MRPIHATVKKERKKLLVLFGIQVFYCFYLSTTRKQEAVYIKSIKEEEASLPSSVVSLSSLVSLRPTPPSSVRLMPKSATAMPTPAPPKLSDSCMDSPTRLSSRPGGVVLGPAGEYVEGVN